VANNMTVSGNVTRDPELRYTQGGKATCVVGIADSRRYQVNGNWEEQTQYWNLVFWEQAAENAAATFTKGMRIMAHGRVQIRDYEGKDGQKGIAREIIVDEAGPTIRWATATVERNAKDGMTPSSAPRPAAASNEFDSFGSDEEPF
jgi:single-strand DNA-binding protein